MENVRFTERLAAERPQGHVRDKAVREEARPAGRLLVRKSGTEPVIRIMGEGDNEKLVREVVREVVQLIRDASA